MTETFKASRLQRTMRDLALAPEVGDIELSRSRDTPGPRRRAARAAAAKMTNLRVLEHDGALVLDERPLVQVSSRRRGGQRMRTEGQVVAEEPMRLLPYNQVTQGIQALDRKLNPVEGLRQWKAGKFIGSPGEVQPRPEGKILLFVHGTFSKSEAFFDQIDRKRFTEGQAFLRWASKHYDQILTFDHPTLSVSPFVNAHQLSLAMGNTRADVDVICHSRGGLVSRWWVEAMDRGSGNRRVVFVGSPLAGTGLASPANIRSALSMFYNIGNAVTKLSMAVPFLQVATGLFQIITSVLRVAGKTPLPDAVISIVPGLAGQSRVGNNMEILSLREHLYPGAASDYYFVQSNFESEKHGWRFWKHFRDGQWKHKLADVGTDILFDGDNDLVVDTTSMTSMTDGFTAPLGNIYDFGTSSRVMHTNYFEQKETMRALQNWLK